ncbi:helix-turn-helix domain-containing protein [Paenirhodobacter populi]|nr:helix-turn-helix domain-containing protein [Sinirhodobacter populi]
MTTDPEAVIKQLKAKFNVDTDVDLARKLRIEKSTISSWKSRGRVPSRFLRILSGENHEFIAAPPVGWGEEEEAAFSLALFRFSRAFSDVISRGEYRSLVQLFTPAAAHFWWLMSQAQEDLIKKQAHSGVSVSAAEALVMFDDLEHGSGAVERDRKGPFSGASVAELYGMSDGQANSSDRD